MGDVALVVGESLVDVVHDGGQVVAEHPGGSAANVAVALARLGRPTRLATAYADDEYGRLIANHLTRNAVALACDPASIGRTSVARATLTADRSASYEFDLEWRLNPVDLAGALPLVVHACSLGAVLAPGASDVLALLRETSGSALVSYDLNVRPAVTGTGPDLVDAVERIAAASDLVKASDEDLEALYPGVAPEEAAYRLLALGPVAVVVTAGEAGPTWIGRHLEVTVPPAPAVVADTIGAGDTFGAGVLDALWERDLLDRTRLAEAGRAEVTAVLTHAARAAAVTVSRPGADPPSRSDLS